MGERRHGSAWTRWLIGVAGLCIGLTGCTPPGEPVFRFSLEGDEFVGYDRNRDGRPDYVQQWQSGRPVRLWHDADHDGVLETFADRSADGPLPGMHLVLVVPGVSHPLVDRLWQHGHFRLFHRPGAVVYPFPGWVDAAMGDLLCARAPAGYGWGRLDRTTGRLVRQGAGQVTASAWRARVHKTLDVRPDAALDLSGLLVTAPDAPRFVVAHVHLSGLSAGKQGTGQIERFLTKLDLEIEQLVARKAGDLNVTVLSGPPVSLVPWEPAGLDRHLRAKGYRVGPTLGSDRDVVVAAEHGAGAVALYGRDAPALVDALAGLPAVELVACRQGDRVVVRAGPKHAVIRRVGGGLAYQPVKGDPLGLEDVLDSWRRSGRLRPDGVLTEQDWLRATADQPYPDAVRRIWRALDNQVRPCADVLASVRPGLGYARADAPADRNHPPVARGSLRREDSLGVLMSTAFSAPAWLRADGVTSYMRPLMGDRTPGPATQPAQTVGH